MTISQVKWLIYLTAGCFIDFMPNLLHRNIYGILFGIICFFLENKPRGLWIFKLSFLLLTAYENGFWLMNVLFLLYFELITNRKEQNNE